MAIGFHDAYVAAASQKAALEAWGASGNLFAQGIAEQVTDPALMKAPLERPGEVVKVLRGSAAEQVKALGAARKSKKDKPSPASGSDHSGDRPSPRPSPARGRGGRKARPSRAALDKAERALRSADERFAGALEKVRREEEALAAKRRELERRHADERERLQRDIDDARSNYHSAMAEWAG